MAKNKNLGAPKSQPKTTTATPEGELGKETTGTELESGLVGGEIEGSQFTEQQGTLASTGGDTSEPEPEPETVKAIAPSTEAIRASLDKWKSVFGPRELQRTQKDVDEAAESLKRAYAIALTDKDNTVVNMKMIMLEFHNNKELYRDTTLYAGSPSLDRGFFMRMTQWIYTITRSDEAQWGEEMSDIGYSATQQIAKECPTPAVMNGFEAWLGRVFPS